MRHGMSRIYIRFFNDATDGWLLSVLDVIGVLTNSRAEGEMLCVK